MELSFKEGRMESSSLSVHYYVQTTKNRLCKYTSLDIYILLSKTLGLVIIRRLFFNNAAPIFGKTMLSFGTIFAFKIFNPCLTIALFNPTNGTTSQTVPSETKSK